VGDLADTTRLGEAAGKREKLGPWPEKKKKNKAPAAPVE
jgi:pyruvate kinase